jgi:endonuclease/exonuclease/phosphatase family metal-dependent hydrolase
LTTLIGCSIIIFKAERFFSLIDFIIASGRIRKMKVMSFNTQHCNNYLEGKIDFALMAKTIIDCGADIVGLNEIRGIGEDPEYTAQTEKLSELTGMEYYYFAPAIDIPGKGLYGNAFLSKLPIITAEKIPIPDPERTSSMRRYETRCILKATLEGGITVLVTHFGLNPEEQVLAAGAVLENIEKEKCILMGDFNVTPDNGVLRGIRDRMKDTADAFDCQKLSFPSDVPNRKIDYIFVSEDINILSADIPGIVASDHRPYVAELEI